MKKNKKTLKALIISILLPIFMYSQGVFYDIDTEQAGAHFSQQIHITEITEALIGVRHQKYITTIDTMIGGETGQKTSLAAFIGLAFNISDFQQTKPSGTAIVKIKQEIQKKISGAIHYQPTLNNNIFPVTWQHQIGIGLTFEL